MSNCVFPYIVILATGERRATKAGENKTKTDTLSANCTYYFRTMCSYSEQVEDVEHYNASFDEFDSKMNSFKHIKCFL